METRPNACFRSPIREISTMSALHLRTGVLGIIDQNVLNQISYMFNHKSLFQGVPQRLITIWINNGVIAHKSNASD